MIGVFDSGIGGLSVLGDIRRLMPAVDLLYVADRGRAPYGTRSLEEVRQISFEIVGWLEAQGADTIVVACNTASAAALKPLRSEFTHLPIVGMEPAVKPAAAMTASGVIAVFATAATFQGQLFESVVNAHAGDVEVVGIACPEWVELVEQGTFEGPRAGDAVAGPVAAAVEAGADALVLGCTHFSYLAPIIGRTAGSGIAVIDPGPAVAAQTARVTPTHVGNGKTALAATGDVDELNDLLTRTGILESAGSALPLQL